MKSTRRSFLKLTAGTAAAVMAGATTAQAISNKSGKVTIVHFNDVHSRVGESKTTIGYPRMATFIKEMKKADPNTIALDGGDTFQGTSFAVIDNGEGIADLLNTMNLDGIVWGNSDCDRGKKRLMELADKLNFPCMSANIKARKGKFADEYAIIDLPNGLKLGIVPLSTIYSMYIANPPLLEDLYAEDPLETAIRLVNKLRPEVDLVIGFNHLGVDMKGYLDSSTIAESVPGIDVIIDAHSHTVLPEGRVVNNVLIAQAGSFSSHMGVVEVELLNGKVAKSTARLLSKDDMMVYPEDPTTKAVLDKINARNDKLLGEKLGSTKAELVGARAKIRTSETTLGNFITDAMRESAKTEIAMCIAGSMGVGIQAGEITKKELLNNIIVRNDGIMIQRMSGTLLKEILEINVRSLPNVLGSFMQMSGISYKCDIEQPFGSRVFDIKVGGKAVDMNKSYTVAVQGYQYKSEGFIKAEDIANTGILLEDSVIAYLKKHSPINPKVEGRLVMAKKA